ncbi:MAG: ABC transporter permease [Propionibacteriaceae bacterium]|jgi:peptide/nickel transport system permease protein|nr:ABC transporter permease [Propionibacteriaceae bacterium]
MPEQIAEPPALSPTGGQGRRSHAALLRYIGKRLVIACILLVGMTIVTFSLTNLVPGDPVAAALGQRAADDPAIVARFRAEYGLDKPLLEQYWAYLVRLSHFDLGTSWQTHNAVAADLAKAVPATMEIALSAIVCAALVGLTFGMWSAYRRGKVTDQVLRLVSLVGISVPTFWMAIVCFYIFYYRLGIAPGSGRLTPGLSPPPHVTGMYTFDALLAGDLRTFVDAAAHLALPTMVLTLYTIGLLTRFSRTSFLEVLDQGYIQAAKAKGLPGRKVFFKYVLRAAAIPILTVVGLAFGSLLSGTVLVESIFGWPGLGSYAYNAASKLDLLAVMGVGLFVGLVYLMINLAVDLAYGFIDPRVRVG